MAQNKCLLPRLVLIACGSFSPPTAMHLRMFEIARNDLLERGSCQVVGGIMSPVHDAQQKEGLTAGQHRLAMLRRALRSSNWIRVSDWELRQPQWTPTVDVLEYHKACISNILTMKAEGEQKHPVLPEWLPLELLERTGEVQLRLLVGADLLATFANPALWSDVEIENIMRNYGLVVLTRFGTNAEKFVHESDILSKYRYNIELLTNWTTNNLSSTLVRRLLSRGQSVKYLIDDDVIEYIKENGLYNYKS